MKIPKSAVSKTQKKDKKSKSIRRQLFLVPLIFLVIGIILSLAQYISEKSKSPNSEHSYSKEASNNTSNTVEIEEISEVKQNFNFFDGFYKDVDLDSNVQFEDFINIYKTLYDNDAINSPSVSTTDVYKEIESVNKEFAILFSRFDRAYTRIKNMVKHCNDKSESESDFGDVVFTIFKMVYYLYKFVEDYTSINNIDQQELIVYIEYMMVYKYLKKLISTFDKAINNRDSFEVFNNGIFQNKQNKEFGIKYKNVLSILTTDLYIIKDTNIGLFKDKTENNKGIGIFRINDFRKFKLLVEFTFYQVFLNLFEINKKENKIKLRYQMKVFIYNYMLPSFDVNSIKDIIINEIELNCKDIFSFFENRTEEYRDNWFKGFSKCIERVIDLE